MTEPDLSPEEEAPPAGPGRMERRERASLDALRTLIRDYLTRQYGPAALKGQEVDLDLRLHLTADEQCAIDFDPPLAEQLFSQTGDLSASWGVYEEGRVYCYKCGTSLCEHAAVPDSLMVFAGYDQMGAPQWKELSQALIDLKDERVDQLYQRPPRVTTVYVPGKDLKKEQSNTFGKSSRSYSLLGQLNAGYFLLEGGGRLAITFQAVETRAAGGRFALQLNPVCDIAGGASLKELFDAGWGEWVRRALNQAWDELQHIEERVLVALEQKRADARTDAMKRVPGVLRRLGQSLERGHRQDKRRTRHAQQRREQQRPVHMAVEDLERAGGEQFYFDEKTSTIIVEGKPDRFHVFTQEGRHVTSFTGRKGSADFRLRTHRWRRLEEPEREAFKPVA